MLKSFKKIIGRDNLGYKKGIIDNASIVSEVESIFSDETKDAFPELHSRQNSETTLVVRESNENAFDVFPVEIITMIAMSSGFFGAMNLRLTCKRMKEILSIPYSWSQYVARSPDVIHTQVILDTRLHQFDQILFAMWPISGKNVPCIIHRTFLEQFDFLGGLSLLQRPSGMVNCEFFEHRESLPCYISDVKNRIIAGEIPPVITSEDSPVGGLRVKHSCPECAHYDQQKVIKSEFIHQVLTGEHAISHTYQLDERRLITVKIDSVDGITGYSNDIPAITTKIWKINNVELTKKQLSFYLKNIK